MRPKERIKIFLEKMDLNFVLKLWFPDLDEEVRLGMAKAIYPKLDRVKKLWHEYPDWRFSQVLVNSGIIPNLAGPWYYYEEDDILEKQGVPLREFLLWGQNYDKDMNRLPKTIRRPIKDMDTEHIRAIIDGQWTGSPRYTKAFNEELELRDRENEREV